MINYRDIYPASKSGYYGKCMTIEYRTMDGVICNTLPLEFIALAPLIKRREDS
jgi:hypothetical protein